jgi:hypothetical protein
MEKQLRDFIRFRLKSGVFIHRLSSARGLSIRGLVAPILEVGSVVEIMVSFDAAVEFPKNYDRFTSLRKPALNAGGNENCSFS